jgi:hypothetical protein
MLSLYFDFRYSAVRCANTRREEVGNVSARGDCMPTVRRPIPCPRKSVSLACSRPAVSCAMMQSRRSVMGHSLSMAMLSAAGSPWTVLLVILGFFLLGYFRPYGQGHLLRGRGPTADLRAGFDFPGLVPQEPGTAGEQPLVTRHSRPSRLYWISDMGSGQRT